jgi:virulence-associated protein VagC
MSNIISPTREQSERTAYWEKWIKEHPLDEESEEE